MTQSDSQHIEDRLGSVVHGRYRLLSFLARGGMAAVFLCQDLGGSGKTWALKEMLPAHPSEASMVEDSFRREAEILSGLHHPSLPAVVDSFVENSRPYVVMEYIHGETLADRIRRLGPAGPLKALAWGQQLAEVLDFLHNQPDPIIFRDLKPENVMVTPEDRLKLIDFGLARHFRPGQARDTQAAGSIGYSPPEQWEDSGQSDERSDVYGLGATLYFVLTGRPPTPLYGRQRLPEHDPQIEALVLRCLQPDPALRYPSMRALAADLSALAAVPAEPARFPWPKVLTGLLLLIGVVLSLALQPGPAAPSSSAPPSQLLLRQTRPLKELIRPQLGSAQALPQLQDLVKRFPQDGEAQILLNNALALGSRRPLLHIPVFSSISGEEYEGLQMLNGLALAQRQLNAQGLVDAAHPQAGRQRLVLDFVDCESRQDLTLQYFMRAANDPKVKVAIGPWSSQQLMAVSPIAESTGLPTLAPTASDPRLSSLGPNTLTVADSDSNRVHAVAEYFNRLGLKRVALVRNDENVVSRSGCDQFKQSFAGQTVAELAYLRHTHDYQSLLEELDNSGADCLFMSEYRSQTVVQFAHQLRAKGFGQPLGTLVVGYSESPLSAPDRQLNGLVTASYFYVGADEPSIQNFTRQFKELTGEPTPSHREANSYDSLKLIARAIEKVGFERAVLRDYFTAMPPHSGVSGQFTLRSRQGRRKVYLMKLRDGNFELLDKR
ncbi:ABC transporter substrate-binding protein [bacterium]|nr:ABC transporter substrate-binding protein [bacterium]